MRDPHVTSAPSSLARRIGKLIRTLQGQPLDRCTTLLSHFNDTDPECHMLDQVSLGCTPGLPLEARFAWRDHDGMASEVTVKLKPSPSAA